MMRLYILALLVRQAEEGKAKHAVAGLIFGLEDTAVCGANALMMAQEQLTELHPDAMVKVFFIGDNEADYQERLGRYQRMVKAEGTEVDVVQ